MLKKFTYLLISLSFLATPLIARSVPILVLPNEFQVHNMLYVPSIRITKPPKTTAITAAGNVPCPNNTALVGISTGAKYNGGYTLTGILCTSNTPPAETHTGTTDEK